MVGHLNEESTTLLISLKNSNMRCRDVIKKTLNSACLHFLISESAEMLSYSLICTSFLNPPPPPINNPVSSTILEKYGNVDDDSGIFSQHNKIKVKQYVIGAVIHLSEEIWINTETNDYRECHNHFSIVIPLNWKTHSEKENKWLLPLISILGRHFVDLGQVRLKKKKKVWHYTDTNPKASNLW